MKESSCQFGDDQHLVGIVTEPESNHVSQRAPRGALVLISAGLIPKDGPFRLYAELARNLARAGFLTLRFDLGGIGDSPRSHGGHPLRKRTELEIRAAVDYVIAHHGDVCASRVVVGGLCSGAEDAFRYAEIDPRVTGVVMIDPFAYKTKGWLLRHTMQRTLRRCTRALRLYQPFPSPRPRRQRATAIVASALHTKREPETSLVSYAYMPQPEAQRILTSLLERKASVHFIYTGGVEQAFKHKGQLRAMFKKIPLALGLGEQVTIDRFPTMGHTQVLAEQRLHLVETITERLTGARRDDEQHRDSGAVKRALFSFLQRRGASSVAG